ncbi:MAG: hypothetical protein AAGC93_19545 [Cyanobacteria bacterium P01_F01_bin.53]
MDGAGFEMARLDHWLLIVCFLGLSASGLGLSWQWRQAGKAQRKRARRLSMDPCPQVPLGLKIRPSMAQASEGGPWRSTSATRKTS